LKISRIEEVEVQLVAKPYQVLVDVILKLFKPFDSLHDVQSFKCFKSLYAGLKIGNQSLD